MRGSGGLAPGRLSSSARLSSLDAFRGLAVAGMILVNNPGSWAHVYAPLRHADWHGATPTDLVFPFFVFAMGAAMSFSFAARLERGDSRGRLCGRVAARSVVLYGLGLVMAGYPGFDLATIRLVGVLARLALVYLAAGVLAALLSRRAVAAVMVSLLLAYWALLALVPTPGFGAGDLSPEGNLAAWLDRLVLGAHMWSGGGGVYDPEGLLSTIPAVSSALAGLFAGDHLRRAARGGGGGERGGGAGDRGGARARASLRLVLAGAVLVAVGHVWDAAFPINKPLWTSSYAAWSTGWGLLVLGVLHWAIDARGRRRWAEPLIVYGMNAIAVFVASGLLATTLIVWRVADGAGGTTSAYNRIYEAAFASWAGPLNGSLAFAAATVLLWWGAAWAMRARGVVLKV